MPIQQTQALLPRTPAFIVDYHTLLNNTQCLQQLKQQTDCKVLYAIKALPLKSVMETLKPFIDGFSVSSLYEARLAHDILASAGSIHLTTPGIRASELADLMAICSHISLNSLSQWQRFTPDANAAASLGLRVNPKISFTKDIRFDPCRPHSKLGADLNTLSAQGIPQHVQGLHIHTNFSASDFTPLIQTVKTLKKQLGKQLATLKWLNLGGGYLLNQIENLSPLIELIKALNAEFDLEIIIEPGKALVGNAGFLISSVIDCFDSDGKHIAVLDTAINHNPEVFEYQRQPSIIGQQAVTDYPVTLVGSTCLAGDLFGEYYFERPLKLGDRLVFDQVGAYTLIKANRFNGLPLPDIYTFKNQQLTLLSQDHYQAYRQQWYI